MRRRDFDSLCEDWEIGPSLWRRVVGSKSGSWTRDITGAVEESRKSVQRSETLKKDMKEQHYDT